MKIVRINSNSTAGLGAAVSFLMVSLVALPPEMEAHTTTIVSVDSNGQIMEDRHFKSSSGEFASISANRRFVAFPSDSTGLVVGDTNGFRDVFVHDRLTRQTTRVSLGPGGSEAEDDSQD